MNGHLALLGLKLSLNQRFVQVELGLMCYTESIRQLVNSVTRPCIVIRGKLNICEAVVNGQAAVQELYI